jgi:hypothetical protein
MAAWAKWFPDVLPHVPGCPAPVVRHELRRAAQSLLQVSRAWQAELTPIAITAGTADYAIAPSNPTQQQIVRIEAAWLDGQRLSPMTPDQLDTGGLDDWRERTGAPTGYLQLTPGQVTLYPKPITNATTGLKLRVSLMPADTATLIPDDLALQYSDEIQLGAKGRLMMMPGKPWTNFDLAGTYLSAFSSATNTAMSRAARALVGGRIEARPKWC